MKEIDFLDAVGRVDKQYIEECITYKPPKKTNIWVKSMSAIAACLVLAIAAVLAVNHQSQSVIIDENGFHIEDGVLLSYSGSETDITIPDTLNSEERKLVEKLAEQTHFKKAESVEKQNIFERMRNFFR